MFQAAGLACLLLSAAAPQIATADAAELFDQHCAVCHNTNGTGTPGLAPPLDRPDFWKALGDDAPAYISAVVTKGMSLPITVEGQHYAGMIMIPVAAATDEELASISSWVLDSLGETAMTVTAEEIASMRDSDTTREDIKDMRPQTE